MSLVIIALALLVIVLFIVVLQNNKELFKVNPHQVKEHHGMCIPCYKHHPADGCTEQENEKDLRGFSCFQHCESCSDLQACCEFSDVSRVGGSPCNNYMTMQKLKEDDKVKYVYPNASQVAKGTHFFKKANNSKQMLNHLHKYNIDHCKYNPKK